MLQKSFHNKTHVSKKLRRKIISLQHFCCRSPSATTPCYKKVETIFSTTSMLQRPFRNRRSCFKKVKKSKILCIQTTIANVSATRGVLQMFLQHSLCCNGEEGAKPLDDPESNGCAGVHRPTHSVAHKLNIPELIRRHEMHQSPTRLITIKHPRTN